MLALIQASDEERCTSAHLQSAQYLGYDAADRRVSKKGTHRRQVFPQGCTGSTSTKVDPADCFCLNRFASSQVFGPGYDAATVGTDLHSGQLTTIWTDAD